MCFLRIPTLAFPLCVLALTAGESLAAGSWISTIGERKGTESASAMVLSPDGGCVVAGQRGGLGWTAGISAKGMPKWQKSYGGVSCSFFRAMDQTPGGGYIVAGDCSRTRYAPDDFWCVKMGPSGKALWHKSYGGADLDQVEDVKVVADGGFFLVGRTGPLGAAHWSAWCLRLDAAGNILWQKAFSSFASGYAYSVLPEADGGCVVAGRFDGRLWLFKLGASGSLIWSKTYGPNAGHHRAVLARAADGGLIAVSAYRADATYGPARLWLLRLDPSGGVLWQKVCEGGYAFALSDSPRSVRVSADGSILVGGLTYNSWSGFTHDGFMCRFDSDGNLLWQKALFRNTSGHSVHWVAAVRETGDGDVLAAGYTSSRGRFGDAFVLKMSADGSYDGGCDRMEDTSFTVTDLAASVANATPVETVTTAVASTWSSRAKSVSVETHHMCE